jgi:hypothetical protein
LPFFAVFACRHLLLKYRKKDRLRKRASRYAKNAIL